MSDEIKMYRERLDKIHSIAQTLIPAVGYMPQVNQIINLSYPLDKGKNKGVPAEKAK